MDPGCEQLLAGAGLAEQQHRRVGRGDPLELREHRPDGFALADDGVEAAALFDLTLQHHVLDVEFVTEAYHFLERFLLFGNVQAGAEIAREAPAGEVRRAVVEYPAPLLVVAAESILHGERAPRVEAPL